jgi:hypothetical protein
MIITIVLLYYWECQSIATPVGVLALILFAGRCANSPAIASTPVGLLALILLAGRFIYHAASALLRSQSKNSHSRSCTTHDHWFCLRVDSLIMQHRHYCEVKAKTLTPALAQLLSAGKSELLHLCGTIVKSVQPLSLLHNNCYPVTHNPIVFVF